MLHVCLESASSIRSISNQAPTAKWAIAVSSASGSNRILTQLCQSSMARMYNAHTVSFAKSEEAAGIKDSPGKSTMYLGKSQGQINIERTKAKRCLEDAETHVGRVVNEQVKLGRSTPCDGI